MLCKQMLLPLFVSISIAAPFTLNAMNSQDNALFIAALSGQSVQENISNEISAEALGQALGHAAQTGNRQAVLQLLARATDITPDVFTQTFNRLITNTNLSEETIVSILECLFQNTQAHAQISSDDVLQAIIQAARNRRTHLIRYLALNAA